MLFDTHVHFDGLEASGLEGIIERCSQAGVSRMLAVGGSQAGNQTALKMAELHQSTIHAAIGYDRDCAGKMADDQQRLDFTDSSIVAVGEIGLDFHYHPETKLQQLELFERMLAVAVAQKLPVIVHSRESSEDTIRLLKSYASQCGDRPGVLHCFTGDWAFASRILDCGFYLGFSGILTFRNADSIREAAKLVPAGRILVETDSPYLAPIPKRGQPNEPSFVRHVAECLAKTRGCSVEQIEELTTTNACRLFGVGAD